MAVGGWQEQDPGAGAGPLCAAPGGKTTHLASAHEERGSAGVQQRSPGRSEDHGGADGHCPRSGDRRRIGLAERFRHSFTGSWWTLLLR